MKSNYTIYYYLLSGKDYLIQKAALHGGNSYSSDTIGVGVFVQLLNEYAKLVG